MPSRAGLLGRFVDPGNVCCQDGNLPDEATPDFDGLRLRRMMPLQAVLLVFLQGNA